MDFQLARRIRLFRDSGQVRPEVAAFVTAELAALADEGRPVTEDSAGMVREGGTGYGHLFRSFLPRLRATGADDELIDVLTRRNPLRFLTGCDGAEGARGGSPAAGGRSPRGGTGDGPQGRAQGRAKGRAKGRPA